MEVGCRVEGWPCRCYTVQWMGKRTLRHIKQWDLKSQKVLKISNFHFNICGKYCKYSTKFGGLAHHSPLEAPRWVLINPSVHYAITLTSVFNLCSYVHHLYDKKFLDWLLTLIWSSLHLLCNICGSFSIWYHFLFMSFLHLWIWHWLVIITWH